MQEDWNDFFRSPEQVTTRLDRLIGELRKLQEPYIKNGGPGDVLLVSKNPPFLEPLISRLCPCFFHTRVLS